MTDRAECRIDCAHKLQAYQLKRELSIQDFADVAMLAVLDVSFVASVLALQRPWLFYWRRLVDQFSVDRVF